MIIQFTRSRWKPLGRFFDFLISRVQFCSSFFWGRSKRFFHSLFLARTSQFVLFVCFCFFTLLQSLQRGSPIKGNDFPSGEPQQQRECAESGARGLNFQSHSYERRKYTRGTDIKLCRVDTTNAISERKTVYILTIQATSKLTIALFILQNSQKLSLL